jgi:hypothetical protein
MIAPPREQDGWASTLVSSQAAKSFATLRPLLYLCILAWINVYICREAFFTESTGHFNSMHGEWLALARLGDFHFWHASWWPWWGAGAPFENTYAPLIPALTALIARVAHCSLPLAFHQLSGAAYCLTPVLLYLASWKISGAPGYSFVAGAACSLLSPILWIVPDNPFRFAAYREARRFMLVFEWDDLPHVMCLTLLPLVVWFLWRALKSRHWLDFGITGFVMAAMMLANMFGMVLTAIVAITVPLASDRRPSFSNFVGAAATAVCAYIVVSPWLPPSLILKIHSNSVLDQEAAPTSVALIALAIVALVWGVVYWFTRRQAGNWGFRWLLLFGSIMLLIPFLDQYRNLRFLPQPTRYKLEADLALIWIVVFCLRPLVERIPWRVRVLLVIPLLYLADRQIVFYRHYAKVLLQHVDTAQSIEYQTAKWVEEHLPGQRVMMPGSIGQWADVFANVPQAGAQPYTTSPDFNNVAAVYAIAKGQNAGDRDAAFSILWLKALGAQAIAIPGPQSPEYWHPMANPRKFDGVLPVLRRERDTTIYLVSERPFSLAHVLRPDQLVHHTPVHGLDMREIGPYVAALDDPAAPPATLRWEGNNRAVIQARLQPGEVVSAQITYDPGWHAHVNGAARGIRPDGIGLMAVDAGCSGDCSIVLEYDGGWERKACRISSAGFSGALLIAWVGRGWKRRGRRFRLSYSKPRERWISS